jgi:hypothetical protein
MGVRETQPVRVTRRPTQRPIADRGKPDSTRLLAVSFARDSAGTVWYFVLKSRKATDGKDDPRCEPAAAGDVAVGLRSIILRYTKGQGLERVQVGGEVSTRGQGRVGIGPQARIERQLGQGLLTNDNRLAREELGQGLGYAIAKFRS